ncbi:MAG TPA: glycosyltransferase [Fimbriimonadaceae bacterium]|nr:glycosyltransferase [Fimbriimonadaceae bacterium]
MSSPVFFDPGGMRGKRMSFWAAALMLTLAVLTTAVIASLSVVPLLPRIPGLSSKIPHPKSLIPALPNLDKRRIQYLQSSAKQDLEKEIAAERKHRAAEKAPAVPQGSPIVAAFYSPDEEFGIGSFRDNAANLTHVMPVWLSLDRSDPARLNASALHLTPIEAGLKPPDQELIDIARANGVHVWPVLTNLSGGDYDRAVVTSLFDSPEKETALAASIRDWLTGNGFDGLNVDFEDLDEADYPRLPAFLAVLRQTFRQSSPPLGLSVDIEADTNAKEIAALAANVDLAIAMVYDDHSQDGDAGPIAPADWVEQTLDKFARAVPANKLVAGVGSYAYDWRSGAKDANSLTYQGALVTAQNYRDEGADKVLQLDPDSWNTHFTYTDDDGSSHEVWLLDGVSAFNEWKLAHDLGVRGSALWDLGEEDPSIWRFLNRGSIGLAPDYHALETVKFGPDDLETSESPGDILYARGEPRDAARRIDLDRESGLVDGETYEGYPSSYYLDKTGYAGPKTVSLTFDDGPDPANTPAILDILRRFQIPATFFVIGQNAEKYPGLVERAFSEGHEIGNHTFDHPNLDDATDRRTELELNATERAIEGITGHATDLFRPPYNADSEPSRPEDIRPMLTASRLGYVTVGESIDPQDWRLHANADDTGPLRDPQDIVNAVLFQLSNRDHGNVILLHDGGGDRSATIAALNILIPTLKAKGYSFVPISTLMKEGRDGVMPPLTARDRRLVGLDQAAFRAVFTTEWILRFAFLAAILLGLLRVLLITPLAVIQNRRKFAGDPAFAPSVSVLIAAYNEEAVIARTIASVLASEYPVTDVVVVDDGSTDATYLEIVTRFAGDERVVVLKQANAGKASALNRALTQARGDIVVCVDADTQLKSDAIGLLTRHFADRQIGAVAGNVKVGNRINVLTQWQSVEYVTSQNLDRRAYALLNGISVCPGAIAAWRKSALVEAGGYRSDTLAEDMDLTWRLRRSGWRIDAESGAAAYTEAPDTFRGFFRQRFRWAYGTLQCLWKHKRALGRHGWFGWFTLPSIWLFQILFQVLAPLVDLAMLWTLAVALGAWISDSQFTGDWRPVGDADQTLVSVAFLYGLFFVVELISGFIAFRMDRERPRALWWMFLQRLVYRQIMYAVVVKSVATALRGLRQGWGKIERKGTVGG